MPRVKIELPESFQFSTKYTVTVSDLNYGNHVGNDTILAIAHEARLQYINYLGYKDELSIEAPIGIVVSDAAVMYKSESFYNDQLNIRVATDDFNKYGFDLYYEITQTDTGKEVARVKTGIVCLNYETRKLAEIPETFKRALKRKS